MQWRRQRRITHVIGSSNRALLLARYQHAPPGEEDEEDGLRNCYAKSQENDSGKHIFDQNGPSEYKPQRLGADGHGTSGSKSQKDEAAGSPSQAKVIFNEDEYTRVTTPRQDMLFKKGYFSRRKPWAGNASTSVTPSTAESQSASHSTADGSETTEDQQLLDRDGGSGEYGAAVKPEAQLGYGTFYDHASGYYYEYPVMLVGPAPVPPQMGPSGVLTAVPCGPVPLRPIEWINPAFVPKLVGQPYCMMDYQDHAAASNIGVEEQEGTQVPLEYANGTCNESGTGSASCAGSMTGEMDEPIEEQTESQIVEVSEPGKGVESPKEVGSMENAVGEEDEQQEHQPHHHNHDYHLHHLHHQHQQLAPQRIEELQPKTDANGAPYPEVMLMQQPVPVPHVIPAVPQPYMYPGHYMFGPPLVNVNGVTIQGGPMIRTTDPMTVTTAFAKRRKKKKKRKQARIAVGNTEDEEEGGYSSEYDNGIPSSRVPWTGSPTLGKIAPTTDAATTSGSPGTARPLNPECQEFYLRTIAEPCSSVTVVTPSKADLQEKSASDAASCADHTSLGTMTSLGKDGPPELTCNGLTPTTNSAGSRQQNGSVTEHVTELTLRNDHPATLVTTLINAATTSTTTTTTIIPFATHTTTVNTTITTTTITPTSSDLNSEAERLTGCIDVSEKMPLSEETSKTESGARTEHHKMPPRTDVTDSANHLSSANEKCIQSIDPTNYDYAVLDANANGDAIIDDITATDFHSPQIPVQTPTVSPIVSIASVTPATTITPAAKSPSSPTESPGPVGDEKSSCESSFSASKINSSLPVTPTTESHNAVQSSISSTTKTSGLPSRKKYAAKNSKVLREATPGPDEEKHISGSTEQVNGSTEGKSNGETTNDSSSKPHRNSLPHCNAEDSGFESQQSRRAEYPITEAVKEWLRKANSPDLFITCRISTDSDTEDDEGGLENKPSKNLFGNPMSALSANTDTSNVPLSCAADYGGFAKSSNTTTDHGKGTRAATSRRRRKDLKGAKKKSGERANKRVRNVNDDSLQNQAAFSPSDSSARFHSAGSKSTNRTRSVPKRNVGDVCEFSEKDSVAGMRVAANSQTNLKKKAGARRVKRSGKPVRKPVENISLKMRRVGNNANEENDEGIASEDTLSVKTFEKGEIVVSRDGTLLTTAAYEPISLNDYDTSDETRMSGSLEEEESMKESTEGNLEDSVAESIQDNSDVKLKGEDAKENEGKQNYQMMRSISSIEEPDVLECWEVETIEPVITPKKMLQSHGIFCVGEAAEDDVLEMEHVNIEHVQKYYRLARESAASIEEDNRGGIEIEVEAEISQSIATRTVPNDPRSIHGSACGPEIPVEVPIDKGIDSTAQDNGIPVEEAFEVYESYYTGKAQISPGDMSFFKKNSFYGQRGDGPVPCRPVCCNLQ